MCSVLFSNFALHLCGGVLICRFSCIFPIRPLLYQRIFLEKFGIATSERKDFKVKLSTEEGFKFNVRVTNSQERTFFAGTQWKEFIRVYSLSMGDELVFSLDEEGSSIPVTSTHQPIFHPCMLFVLISFMVLIYPCCSTNILSIITSLFRNYIKISCNC